MAFVIPLLVILLMFLLKKNVPCNDTLFASVLPFAASLLTILERETLHLAYSLLTINVVAFVYDGDNWHWCVSYSKLVWTVARDCEALNCYRRKKNRSSTTGTMHFSTLRWLKQEESRINLRQSCAKRLRGIWETCKVKQWFALQ